MSERRERRIVHWLDNWGDRIDDGDRPWLIDICQSILRHTVDGRPNAGSFVKALLSNNLEHTVATGDDCAMRNLRVLVSFIRNEVPLHRAGRV